MLLIAFLVPAEPLAGLPVELRLSQSLFRLARGAYYVDASKGVMEIQVRTTSWGTYRASFLSVFLHEVAHARFHAAALQPSTGKVFPPLRSSNISGALLGIKDSFDELRTGIQAPV